MLVAAVLSRPRGQLPIRFKCGSTHFTLTESADNRASADVLTVGPFN